MKVPPNVAMPQSIDFSVLCANTVKKEITKDCDRQNVATVFMMMPAHTRDHLAAGSCSPNNRLQKDAAKAHKASQICLASSEPVYTVGNLRAAVIEKYNNRAV